MISLLASPPFAPFSIAAVVLLGLAAIEILGTLLGGFSSTVAHATHDAHLGADDGGLLATGLGWLNVGRVPLLLLLIALLASFAAAGFLLQGTVRAVLGGPLPALPAAGLALAAALPATRTASRLLARIVPRDETYAVTANDLVGRTGAITVGPVRAGVVARARVRDAHGNLHFPRVEVWEPGTEIPEGTRVLVIAAENGILKVAPADSPPLPPD